MMTLIIVMLGQSDEIDGLVGGGLTFEILVEFLGVGIRMTSR